MRPAETGVVATRVIDDSFTVVDQNRAMTELADDVSGPITCREQMQGPDCGTDRCAMVRLREGEISRMEKPVEMEFPDGTTADLYQIAERYTTGTGEFEGIIESFRPRDGSEQREETVSLPAPTGRESFREALAQLLARAASKGVQVGSRSWECPALPPRERWDVEVVPVRSKDDGT